MRRLPPASGTVVLVSGFCSLVYQSVWERMLRYHFGGDSIASAIVTGTFLLGLGIGAVVFARWRRNAFRVYALVELSIGLYAVLGFKVIAPLSTLLGRLLATSIADVEGLRPIVVLAAVVFLLPPCILIGGTAPLMFNSFIRPLADRPEGVGRIYALNTLGAALGVLAGPFVFLNHVSIPVTLAIVGALNGLLGLAIALLGRRVVLDEIEADGRPDAAPATQPPVGSPAWLLGLSAASGFISLGFELVSVRALFLLNPSSAYNFPTVLVSVLLSIALGAALFTRFRRYTPRAALRRVGVLFVAAMAAMLAGVIASASLLPPAPLPHIPRAWDMRMFAAHVGLLVVPMPFLLGAVLPLVLQLSAGLGRNVPARSGPIYLVNAIGAFAGAMLTQFVGFPTVGSRGVVTGLFALGVLVGGWCLARVAPTPTRRLAWAAAGLALAFAPALVPGGTWRMFVTGTADQRVDVVEGVTGVAAIRWVSNQGLVLVNAQFMAQLPEYPRHVKLVTFALSLPRREHVLVLGLGGGSLVRELLKDDAVRRVDVVDWSYELPPLLDRPHVRTILAGAFQDPRVRVYRCDARVAVSLYESGAFDIVVDDLAFPHWVGATSVRSVAFFREVHRILKPGGVLVYSGLYGRGREAIMAAMAQSFKAVYEHDIRSDPVGLAVIVAFDQAIFFDPERVELVVEPRRQMLGLTSRPYGAWLQRGLRPVSPAELARARPIEDDLLTQEYFRDPGRDLWRSLVDHSSF
jgi:spermidine synthase